MAADTAANRCQESAFPYPAVDDNPLTRPNLDGPVKRIDKRIRVINVSDADGIAAAAEVLS